MFIDFVSISDASCFFDSPKAPSSCVFSAFNLVVLVGARLSNSHSKWRGRSDDRMLSCVSCVARNVRSWSASPLSQRSQPTDYRKVHQKKWPQRHYREKISTSVFDSVFVQWFWCSNNLHEFEVKKSKAWMPRCCGHLKHPHVVKTFLTSKSILTAIHPTLLIRKSRLITTHLESVESWA